MGKSTADTRSCGGDSLEVLRISDSSPSSAESSFRELDDVFLQTQTRIWLGEVLHARFDEETAIADLLADGEVLFQVSRVVWKMLWTKCVDIKYPKTYVYEPTASGKSGGKYMPYSNVDSFLKVCQILGLTGVDLFSPSDVVEKRDTRRVCMCIRSLSKKARSKHLNVPDFDIVTYTIAMPTDMVGWIRRNLEQSQCSTSSYVICSRCMHSKGKYRQRNDGVDCAEQYELSLEESDDAESSHQVFEPQSPASNTSFDAPTLPHLFRENSPGGDSVVDENFHTPENTFRLEAQNHHDDEQNIPLLCQSISSAESAISCSGHRFASKRSVVSSQSCHEGQIDLSAGTSFSHLRQLYLVNDTENGGNADFDCWGTCATSAGNSLKELDGQFLVDSKEALNGKICTSSIPWYKSLRKSNSSVTLADMKEEFKNVCLVSSCPSLSAICTTKDADGDEPDHFATDENLNASCTGVAENEAKQECDKIMVLPAEISKSRVLCTYSGNVDRTRDCANLKTSNVHADDSVVDDTFLTSHCRSGSPDFICHKNNEGNSVLSEGESRDDKSEYIGTNVSVLSSNCQTSDNGHESKIFNDIGDVEISPPNPFLGQVMAPDSEEQSDTKDGFAGACTRAHFANFQNLEDIEEDKFALKVLISRDLDTAREGKECMTTDFPSKDADETNQNLSLLKFNLADRASSVNGCKFEDTVEFSIRTDCIGDTEKSQPDMKIEDIDAINLSLLTVESQSRIIGIQNDAILDNHCMNMPHECSAVVKTSIDESVSKYSDLNGENTLRNICLNRLDDAAVADQFVSHDFTLENEVYRDSNAAVSNGSNGLGISNKYALSHDIYLSNACGCLRETSKDDVVTDDAKSTDEVYMLDAIDVPGMATGKHLNDFSIHMDAFNMEIDYEAQLMALTPDKVAVMENKECSNNATGRLQQASLNTFSCNGFKNRHGPWDPEGRSKREHLKTLAEQKESSCHTNGMCKEVQTAIMQVSDEKIAESNLSCLNSRVEDPQCENITEEKGDGERSSVECMEKRYEGNSNAVDSVPQVKQLDISVEGTGDRCDLESKVTMIGHLHGPSPPDEMFHVAVVDQCESLLVKQDHRGLLSAGILDYDKKLQQGLDELDSEPMPVIDSNAGSTVSRNDSQTGMHVLGAMSMEYHVNLDKACLGTVCTSNLDPDKPDIGTVEFVSPSDSIHQIHDPNSSSMQFECLASPPMRNQPCSIPKFLEKTSDGNQNNRVKEDSWCPIDGTDILVQGPNVNHEDNVGSIGNMHKEVEEHERDRGMSYSSKGINGGAGAERKPKKKLLLKSVAGGILFSALFILLHLRKRREKEKFDGKEIAEPTMKSQVEKPTQERIPMGNFNMVYPGERLIFKD